MIVDNSFIFNPVSNNSNSFYFMWNVECLVFLNTDMKSDLFKYFMSISTNFSVGFYGILLHCTLLLMGLLLDSMKCFQKTEKSIFPTTLLWASFVHTFILREILILLMQIHCCFMKTMEVLSWKTLIKTIRIWTSVYCIFMNDTLEYSMSFSYWPVVANDYLWWSRRSFWSFFWHY